MFQICISSIILSFCIIFIYRKYFRGNYVEGEWLTVDEDIKFEKLQNWDISNKSNIRIANFNSYRKYFFGKNLFHKLKRNSGILMNFQEKFCTLDVYSEDLKNIYHITDPECVIFSTLENKDHYYLDHREKYIFFLRINDARKKYKLIKYNDIRKLNLEIPQKNQLTIAVNEENLRKELEKRCMDLINSMEKRNYFLVEIMRSEEYVSFPSNTISNKLSIKSREEDVIILVCVNKTKTSQMLNHTIEVNSLHNNINWSPENEENISHLILDNSDFTGEFSFYERTLNISNTSNILNFEVMIFRR